MPFRVAVMLFYQVGELFQSYAVNQSRKSIASLMDICPEYANVLRQGKIEIVDPEEVSLAFSTPAIFPIASSIFAAQFAQSKSCNL